MEGGEGKGLMQEETAVFRSTVSLKIMLGTVMVIKAVREGAEALLRNLSSVCFLRPFLLAFLYRCGPFECFAIAGCSV